MLISLTAILYGISPGISWAVLRPSPCYPGCFCEAFRPGAIVQPLSTYSNLGFVLVGLGITASIKIVLPGDINRSNLFLRQPVYVVLYGLAVIYTGLTSFFYHVSLTLAGRWADYMGMYAVASFAVIFNLARLRVVQGRAFFIAYAIVNIGLALPMMLVPSLHFKRALLLGVILAIPLLESFIYITRRPYRLYRSYFFYALGVLAVATAVNLLDESGLWCHPTSLWQWHAAWHFLAAGSIGLLFLYYRTEDDRSRQSRLNKRLCE